MTLVHLPRVTSTMNVLDDLIAASAPKWTVVLADEQTEGLGRAGRVWDAEPGSALLCSILVRPRFSAERVGMLAIAVGVALARVVEALGVPVTLKWPNDVLLHGRKLAGILIRARTDASGPLANVGIGLNLQPSSRHDNGRASLAEAVTRVPPAADLARLVVGHLADLIEDASAASIGEAWMERGAFIGEWVSVEDGPQSIVGRMIGIDDRGALLIQSEDGRSRAIVAGDVVRGPRAKPRMTADLYS